MASKYPKGIIHLSKEIITEIAMLLPPPAKLNMALASRIILSEAAFKALWRYLPSPLPALFLVPGFHIDERSSRWTFRESLNKADLTRFRYYSQFVRTCIFPSATVGMHTITEVFRVGGTFFPSLNACHFGDSLDEFPQHNALTLSHISTCIQTASIHIPMGAVGLNHTFSKSLLSLTISGAISPVDLSSLRSCVFLQELAIIPAAEFRSSAVSFTALEIASGMLSLRRLSLWIKGRPLCTAPRITSVTSLVLRGEPFEIQSALTCFFGLQDITLKFKHFAGLQQEACIACFSHIGQQYRSTLARLNFESDWIGTEPFPLSESLKLLYRTVEDLKCLSLSVEAHYMWTADITRMSKHWPNLEEINLSVGVSPGALRVLARLPRLRIISVKSGNICRVQIPSMVPFDQSFSPAADYSRGLFSEKVTIQIPVHRSTSGVQLNFDVLENIFGYLNPYELLPLLVVSKPVYRVAIKFIWRVIPSLVPLIKLLPGRVTKKFMVYYWVPSITANNFNNFDHHARMIERVAHEILCCPITYETIDESIFETLQEMRPGHTLLPRLKVLRYFRPQLSSASYALPFISTCLQSLALDIKDDCTSRLLASIFLLSPMITDIRLSGLLTDLLLVSLRCFTKLSVLSLSFTKRYYEDNPPTQYAGQGPQVFVRALSAAFDALEDISTLRTLAYNIPFGETIVPFPNGRWCRTVVNLRLEAPLEAMLQQFSAFRGLKTASLHLRWSTRSILLTVDPLEECCRCLAMYSGQSLRALSLTCGEVMLRPVFEHIRPLMGISGMQAFSLRLQTSLRYSNQPWIRRLDAEEIASNWPALEELYVTGCESDIPLAPTFYDLLPLSRLTALKGVRIQGLGLSLTPVSFENTPNLDRATCEVINTIFPDGQLQLRPSNDSNQLHDVLSMNQPVPSPLGC